jgi:hypothetical protein
MLNIVKYCAMPVGRGHVSDEDATRMKMSVLPRYISDEVALYVCRMHITSE